MDKVINGFLETEIKDQDFYDGIIDFITNNNIRNGEYECNEYVIKKMDHTNFIIFLEYTFPDDKNPRIIPGSTSIYRDDLMKIINEFAKKQGFQMNI
ncbi:hypothetical protein [Neobacillus bataviensis]|uniref:hypothetical protein n=1 Tax=Neobacillus bataviensis TaxID=220685 RepID=UPI001CBD6769|nr:hypothetical protein [Neobacillus bataviensis]